MGNLFAGSEIVELGIQIEINGRDFYNTLAKQPKRASTRELFGFLAREEGKHIAVFQRILDSVHKYEPPEAYPGEYFAYLNALAGQYVFTQKNKGKVIAENIASEKEAVNMGIGFEKDSIVFYDGMKKIILESDREVVERLIEQEQDHLLKLLDLTRNLT